jgi:cyclopropane-fatty-acyl-phospholipid synthase
VSTQREVEVSYDVGNDFFRLWLDRRMNYTCAVFDHTDDLEEAQVEKLRVLHDFARVTPDKAVLDIGCGWGANLQYLAADRGVKAAHGITLSSSQLEEIQRRAVPGVTATLCDYRDYQPPLRFDAVSCICMMEHIATPQQARSGEAVELYRDFFRKVHRWTNPGAHFALQTILREEIPRDVADLRELSWGTQKIFPGGIALRMEDIARSVDPGWEILQVRTRREDYRKTTAEWLRRLRLHEGEIRERWGGAVFDDYQRYLAACVKGFERRYLSLAQWSLRRLEVS